MRIALLTYRGNMYCGGQGIYAACLAREWQRAGHDVHVFAGPPLPELEDGIPLHTIDNDNVFGREHPEFYDPQRRFSLLRPLSLWELGVSRFGVFPEMQTFGLRLLMRWKRIQEKHRFDVVFDNQCLSWGLLGIRATGVPVVSVIHHPLHIDREADFTIDPRLVKKIKRTLYFPLFMQQQVAPRLDRIVTVSEASRAEIERYCKELADASERARFSRFGRTHEGRDLVLLVISSRANLDRAEEIQDNLRRLGEPRERLQDAELDQLVEMSRIHGCLAAGAAATARSPDA